MGLSGDVLEGAAWVFSPNFKGPPCAASHSAVTVAADPTSGSDFSGSRIDLGEGAGPWQPVAPSDGAGSERVLALLALAPVGGWHDALPEVEAIRRAALAAAGGDDGLTHPPLGSPGSHALALDARILVIWDSLDAHCTAVARVLSYEFGALCSFADLRNRQAITKALERRPGVPRHLVCCEGGVSAVLPSGVCIAECAHHPKLLLYELRILATLRPTNEEALITRDRRWFAPLRRLWHESTSTPRSPNDGPWWLQPSALRIISGSLEVNNFVVIDGFLSPGCTAELQDAVRFLYDNGEMISGIAEQAGTHSGYWDDPFNSGDFLNRAGKARKWTLHGDYRAWCSDEDVRVPVFRKHTRQLDRLVNLLKARSSHDDCAGADGLSTVTSERLRDVDFHEYIMAVCYPAENRARYLRHCDVSRGAVLTSILYLNEGWRQEDGGCLRLYWPGEHSGQKVKQDILPVAGRLLLFWASEDCPHEVLATKRDRFTMSIWYKTGKDAISGSNWLPDLLLRHQPVAPLTMAEALRRTGIDEAMICQVEFLQGILAKEPSEAGKIAALRAALRSDSSAGGLSACGECKQCGRGPDVDGRLGTDEYVGQFFCNEYKLQEDVSTQNKRHFWLKCVMIQISS